jgi:hypothetical protein
VAKQDLSIAVLLKEAKAFCHTESMYDNVDLYGITDGKAVGTYIEHKFTEHLLGKYEFIPGSSARGIDLPAEGVNTDIKVTSIRQPQSSCPFTSARQKIFGLGYNLLLFVYDKQDIIEQRITHLKFVHCVFIEAERTGDFQITSTLRQMVENDANEEDIVAYLSDRNLPADNITMQILAREILKTPPQQGYVTISNALQWRLQYGRVIGLQTRVEGIVPIIRQGEKQ